MKVFRIFFPKPYFTAALVIMGTYSLTSFSFATSPLDTDESLFKRSVPKGGKPAKKHKSQSQTYHGVNAVEEPSTPEAIPSLLVYVANLYHLHIFLDDKSSLNLVSVSCNMREAYPFLPLWSNLIYKSGLILPLSETPRDFFLKSVKDSPVAKLFFAIWLDKEGLNHNPLQRIIYNYDEIVQSLEIVDKLSLWENLKTLKDFSSFSKIFKKLELQEYKAELLRDPYSLYHLCLIKYTIFHDESIKELDYLYGNLSVIYRDFDLPSEFLGRIRYLKALILLQDKDAIKNPSQNEDVEDDLQNDLPPLYLAHCSQNTVLSPQLRAKADSLRVRIWNSDIEEGPLTVEKPHQTLLRYVESEQIYLSGEDRAYTIFLLAKMKHDGRIGNDDLPDLRLSQLLVQVCQDDSIKEALRNRAAAIRIKMRYNGQIRNDEFTDVDVIQALSEESQRLLYKDIDKDKDGNVITNFKFLLQPCQSQEFSPELQANIDFLRAVIRFFSYVEYQQLIKANPFNVLIESEHLSADQKDAARLMMALARIRYGIGEEHSTYEDSYQKLLQISEDDQASERSRMRAIYERALMRYNNSIANELLTDKQAFDLLNEAKSNFHLSWSRRQRATVCMANMRFRNRVGDDQLTFAKACDILLYLAKIDEKELKTADEQKTCIEAKQLLANMMVQKLIRPEQCRNIQYEPLLYTLAKYHRQNDQLKDVCNYNLVQSTISRHLLGPSLAPELTDPYVYHELTDAYVYHLLLQLGQSKHLNEQQRFLTNYMRAIMRVNGHIQEEQLTDTQAAEILLQAIQKEGQSETRRLYTKYFLATMRAHNRIEDERLTDVEASELLLEVNQSEHLPQQVKTQANLLRAMMRAQNRIGDDHMTEAEAYNPWYKDIRYSRGGLL